MDPNELRRKPRVRDLYDGETVNINLTKSGRTFTVLRGQLRGMSECFSLNITENVTSLDLEDVDDRVFESFVGWLYNGNLTWAPKDPKLQAKYASNTVATCNLDGSKHIPADTPDEEDLQNPETWSWRNLFNCFIFAHHYDTKLFRNLVMDVILVKSRQRKPRSYRLPSFTTMKKVFEALPTTSPLHRFCIHLLLHRCTGSSRRSNAETTYEQLPHAILAQVAVGLTRLKDQQACTQCAKGRLFCTIKLHGEIDDDAKSALKPCTYHEHDTPEAGKLCKEKWEPLIKKHGINLKWDE